MEGRVETSRSRAGWDWLKARGEVLVPVVGLPLFFSMVGWMDVQLSTLQAILVWGAAIVYAALVLWSPMTLPAKEPQSLTWARVRWTAVIVGLPVAGAVLLQAAAYQPSSTSGQSSGLAKVLLVIVLGIAGVGAERTLPVDLFPVLRRREARRIAYLVVAALFLTMVLQLWTEIFGGLALALGQALGEIPPESQEVGSYFDGYSPLGLFTTHLVSAGLEELLFRVGILTGVWALARRWRLGDKRAQWSSLLISALCFGLYHISFSGLSEYFVQAPVTAVLRSFGAGLADGIIYRYRGFTTAVLVHALGNWLFLMLSLS